MEELYENIEKYLHGKLTEEEHRAFRERLEQEPELEAEVNAFRLSEEVIEERIADQLRADFASWDQAASTQQPAKVVRLSNYRRALAIAAGFLFLSVFVFLQWRSTQQNFNSASLAAHYHSTDIGTTRSNTADDHELSRATTAMQAGDYALAIEELTAVSDSSVYYSDAQFLLADAYYRNGALDQADTTLEPLLQLENTLLKEKAEWLKILTALKAGKKNDPDFRRLLQQISGDTAHSFQPKAAELRATLDKFWVKWVE